MRIGSLLALTTLFGALLLARGPAHAAPIAMPAGSTVWMHFEASVCPDADGDDCVGSNLPGVAPPNGIPLSTFTDGVTSASGYAEILPGQVRTLAIGPRTAFMRASFQDTYTVHGAVPGTFPITVTLSANGTARTVNPGSFLPYRLVSANVGVEIGTFDPSAVAMQEQSRVSAFSPATEALWTHPTVAQNTPYETPFSVSASHTQTVGVGDVFDLAYGVNSAFSNGEIDLLANGATISFTLPAGVWITSELGGSWGVVPEPSTLALVAVGLGALASRSRHRATSAG